MCYVIGEFAEWSFDEGSFDDWPVDIFQAPPFIQTISPPLTL